MTLNLKQILFLIVILLVASLGGVTKLYMAAKEEKNRVKANQKSLLDDAVHYKTKDSLNVISVGNLNLKIRELEKHRAEDIETIEKLNVDIKRIQSLSNTQTETKYIFESVLKDSLVIIEETVVDTIRVIQFQDEWLSFNGVLEPPGNTFKGEVISKDSLLYVEHIVPRKFLFIKFGVKDKRQEIVSKNPHTRILNSEFIRIRE